MRLLPPDLAAHLGGAVTTLCRAWKLVRRDGVAAGFTDHDRDLVLDGVVFAARAGLEAAEATAELGFAVSGGEVSGALIATGITEDDIAAGRYDAATVETWLVNWQRPVDRLLLDIASIGEVRRADDAFVAELRGVTHLLDEERGRLYRATCSADLGDAHCGISLAAAPYRGEGVVDETDGALTIASGGLAAFSAGWFTGGRLVWSGGANTGDAVEIRGHRRTSTSELDLWQRTARPIAVGDAFTVTAGCDKRLATCRDRFANTVNFRGFPHMPGNDFVVRLARQGEAGMDGGSLFR